MTLPATKPDSLVTTMLSEYLSFTAPAVLVTSLLSNVLSEGRPSLTPSVGGSDPSYVNRP